jgi:hypothetical protein
MENFDHFSFLTDYYEINRIFFYGVMCKQQVLFYIYYYFRYLVIELIIQHFNFVIVIHFSYYFLIQTMYAYILNYI